jgi:integrase
VERGWLKVNPAEKLSAEGTKARRKKQLRINEARRWSEKAIELAAAGDDGAVAALSALVLGLRASEITDRVVRDLDDDGRVLWIDHGKTENAERFLEIPSLLRPHSLALTKGRLPGAPLFWRTSTRTGKARDRHWVLRSVRRICAAAGVPTVCAHSLRGLHSTLAQEAGVTGHLVAGALVGVPGATPGGDVDRQTAAQLGHGSTATTHGHYTAPGAVERARVARANLRLVPGTRE